MTATEVRRGVLAMLVAVATAAAVSVAPLLVAAPATAVPTFSCPAMAGWTVRGGGPSVQGSDTTNYTVTCTYDRTVSGFPYQSDVVVVVQPPGTTEGSIGCGVMPSVPYPLRRTSADLRMWGWGTTQHEDGTLAGALDGLWGSMQRYALACDGSSSSSASTARPTTTSTATATPTTDPTSDPDPATDVCPPTQQAGKVRVEALDSAMISTTRVRFEYIVASKRNTWERIVVEFRAAGITGGDWYRMRTRMPTTVEWGRASATIVQSLLWRMNQSTWQSIVEGYSASPDLQFRFWVIAKDTAGNAGSDCAALDLSGVLG